MDYWRTRESNCVVRKRGAQSHRPKSPYVGSIKEAKQDKYVLSKGDMVAGLPRKVVGDLPATFIGVILKINPDKIL